MKNKISLNIDHPNAKRMGYFLNSIKETLKEVPLDLQSWQLAELIRGGCQFIVSDQKQTTITLLFFDSYFDANHTGKANAKPGMRWGVNGDVLYLIQSEDPAKTDSLLGLFAGEE